MTSDTQKQEVLVLPAA